MKVRGFANEEKLRAYGFSEEDGIWTYHVRPLEGFELIIRAHGDELSGELFDTDLHEPYTLHLVEEATGEFVGRVREAYLREMEAVLRACFDGFGEPMTKALFEAARRKYGDEPEYLWEDHDGAVLRRKDTGKWYAVVLTVERYKLGLEGKEKVEIVDVRADPVALPDLVDGVKVFRGWHMNKKHWITLLLDGTLPIETLEEFLAESYLLAK